MARPQVCSDPAGCLSGGIRPANQAVRVSQGTTYMPSTPPVGAGPAALQMRPNPFVGSTLAWFFNGTNNYQSGNVSLTKRSTRGLTFSGTEQVSMQFRAEAFNVFNHPNFASPNPVVFTGNNYSSSAGAITSTSTASRQIQFALKLLF